MVICLFIPNAALPPSMVNMGWEYPAQLLHPAPGGARLADAARDAAVQATMHGEAGNRQRPAAVTQTVSRMSSASYQMFSSWL